MSETPHTALPPGIAAHVEELLRRFLEDYHKSVRVILTHKQNIDRKLLPLLESFFASVVEVTDNGSPTVVAFRTLVETLIRTHTLAVCAKYEKLATHKKTHRQNITELLQPLVRDSVPGFFEELQTVRVAFHQQAMQQSDARHRQLIVPLSDQVNVNKSPSVTPPIAVPVANAQVPTSARSLPLSSTASGVPSLSLNQSHPPFAVSPTTPPVLQASPSSLPTSSPSPSSAPAGPSTPTPSTPTPSTPQSGSPVPVMSVPASLSEAECTLLDNFLEEYLRRIMWQLTHKQNIQRLLKPRLLPFFNQFLMLFFAPQQLGLFGMRRWNLFQQFIKDQIDSMCETYFQTVKISMTHRTNVWRLLRPRMIVVVDTIKREFIARVTAIQNSSTVIEDEEDFNGSEALVGATLWSCIFCSYPRNRDVENVCVVCGLARAYVGDDSKADANGSGNIGVLSSVSSLSSRNAAFRQFSSTGSLHTLARPNGGNGEHISVIFSASTVSGDDLATSSSRLLWVCSSCSLPHFSGWPAGGEPQQKLMCRLCGTDNNIVVQPRGLERVLSGSPTTPPSPPSLDSAPAVSIPSLSLRSVPSHGRDVPVRQSPALSEALPGAEQSPLLSEPASPGAPPLPPRPSPPAPASSSRKGDAVLAKCPRVVLIAKEGSFHGLLTVSATHVCFFGQRIVVLDKNEVAVKREERKKGTAKQPSTPTPHPPTPSPVPESPHPSRSPGHRRSKSSQGSGFFKDKDTSSGGSSLRDSIASLASFMAPSRDKESKEEAEHKVYKKESGESAFGNIRREAGPRVGLQLSTLSSIASSHSFTSASSSGIHSPTEHRRQQSALAPLFHSPDTTPKPTSSSAAAIAHPSPSNDDDKSVEPASPLTEDAIEALEEAEIEEIEASTPKASLVQRVQFCINLDSISSVLPRRYLAQDSAIEVFALLPSIRVVSSESNYSWSTPSLTGESSFFLTFSHFRGSRHRADIESRTRVFRLLCALRQLSLEIAPAVRFKSALPFLLVQWQSGQMSNFEYLMQLNRMAGRSFADVEQYPVMPWVIKDYTSAELNLADPNVFRDFTRPMGAQLPERREMLKARRDEALADMTAQPDGKSLFIPPFHHGSHYSNEATVSYYLLRVEPYTGLNRDLNGGRFDLPNRLFDSVNESYRLSCSTDNKELTPEFFDTLGECLGSAPDAFGLHKGRSVGDFLLNGAQLELGVKQSGRPVDAVGLPPWAKSAEDFIRINRAALESDYSSAHLHEWIDLIFGYKQRGKDADEALNVFFYLTYEGSVDLNSISDFDLRKSIEDQIAFFGQTPSQLLTTPHPRRNSRAL